MIREQHYEQIKALQTVLDVSIMRADSPVVIQEITEMTKKQYYAALKGVHTNKVCQLADGYWKTKNPQKRCKTELELLQWLYNYYFDSTTTLRDVYTDWITEFEQDPDRSYDTVGHYKSDWKRWFEYSDIAEMDITEIRASDIKKEYKRITAGRAITSKTFNNVRSLLNSILAYATDNDILPYNTALSASTKGLKFKISDNQDEVYTNEERSKILAVAMQTDHVYARAVVTMFCMDIRIGELRALKWDSINFDKRDAYIHREIVREKDANGKTIYVCVEHTKSGLAEGNRYQPLSDTAYETLKTQRALNPFGEYVFMENGHALDTTQFNRWLKRFCAKAGVRYLSSHKIRFRAVTEMYKAGFDDAQIQTASGHADPRTTDHYKRLGQRMNIDRALWNIVFN